MCSWKVIWLARRPRAHRAAVVVFSAIVQLISWLAFALHRKKEM
jgi:hypothetical protein